MQELENYWISIGLQVRRITYDEDYLAEDSRFIMAKDIKDICPDLLPNEIAIVEYPNLDDNSIPPALLNMGTINLMVSLAIAACVIPVLNAALIRRIKPKKQGKRDITDWVQAIYDKVLAWNFSNPWKTIIGGVAVTIIFICLFPLLKIRQFPFADRNQFAVEIYLPEGSGLSETSAIADSLCHILEQA